VAIGNFDGVHRGHQALVAAARSEAQGRGTEAGVLTFDPHPARFFAPALAPPLLLPLPRRLELLGEAGAGFAVVEPFDAQLAAMEPDHFVAEVLVGSLAVGHVVVGYDFSFGRKRRGNAARLSELGRQLGFGVTVVAPVSADGLTCSSTKIRESLLEGRIEGAALLLGRPPEISGEVVRGASRGRGLGFPTANLRPELEVVPFRSGIYAARALVLDGSGATFAAAVSIGTNPTFTPSGVTPLTVEAHLLDYPGADLYGQRLRVLFVSRLRDERRFDRIEDLMAEIGRDVERTRQLVG
jgi:riboflavin kinase/FMN adenylyltransferase